MKIRWKLLCALLLVSALPMLLLSFMVRETNHELVEDMTNTTREVLIARAEADLLRRVEDHVRIVSREKQIVSLALAAESGKLAQALKGDAPTAPPPIDSVLEASTSHFARLKDGGAVPLKIDKGRVRIDLTHDARIDLDEAQSALAPMLPSFHRLLSDNPELIHWQIVRLDTGVIATYPYYESEAPVKSHAVWMNPASHTRKPPPPPEREGKHPKRRLFPPHEWHRSAKHASPDSVIWTAPYRDPVTGRFIVAAVAPLGGKDDRLGAMMIMVPLGSVLEGDMNLTGFAEGTSSLLFSLQEKADSSMGLKIIAEERKGISVSKDHGGWMAGADGKWLESGSAEQLAQMTDRLSRNQSGVVHMAYDGAPSLWVYAPIAHSQTALALVVPMEAVIGTTAENAAYVKDRIKSQFHTVAWIIAGMIALAAALSFLLSSAMTRRIANVADAFRALAAGDFAFRVDVRGADELSELSRTFNKLAPAMKEQVRLKEALTVAQEVQRSLLPDNPPAAPGLDVAGMSLYCEDTGGDYFDYPHLGIDVDELGVAVGDVSGHGVPAALLMTTARALLRQRAKRGGDLGAVVHDANQLLSEDVRLTGRFMTLFLFAVDVEKRTARWVRAGHDPALVYLPGRDAFSELAGDTGIPLGVDGDWEYLQETTNLEPDSVILIGTDGIWEAAGKDNEMFGKERLRAILRDNAHLPAQGILNAVFGALKAFTADVGLDDDVTLAVIKFLPDEEA